MKRCLSCRVYLERIEGCPHMTCKCWSSLEIMMLMWKEAHTDISSAGTVGKSGTLTVQGARILGQGNEHVDWRLGRQVVEPTVDDTIGRQASGTFISSTSPKLATPTIPDLSLSTSKILPLSPTLSFTRAFPSFVSTTFAEGKLQPLPPFTHFKATALLTLEIGGIHLTLFLLLRNHSKTNHNFLLG